MWKHPLLRTAATFAPAEATSTPDVLPKTKRSHRAPSDHLDAYSIREFCRRHMITPYMFYALQRDGEAPRVMVVGGRKLITAEAAAEWRKARERPAISRGDRGKRPAKQA